MKTSLFNYIQKVVAVTMATTLTLFITGCNQTTSRAKKKNKDLLLARLKQCKAQRKSKENFPWRYKKISRSKSWTDPVGVLSNPFSTSDETSIYRKEKHLSTENGIFTDKNHWLREKK